MSRFTADEEGGRSRNALVVGSSGSVLREIMKETKHASVDTTRIQRCWPEGHASDSSDFIRIWNPLMTKLVKPRVHKKRPTRERERERERREKNGLSRKMHCDNVHPDIIFICNGSSQYSLNKIRFTSTYLFAF